MKIKLFLSFGVMLSGLLVETTIAQTITAPTGQSLTITNPVDITVAGGSLNVPLDGSLKIGGAKVFLLNGTNTIIGRNSATSFSSGVYNTFIGENTGVVNSGGNNNLFLGFNAGSTNSTGSSNIFMGVNTGFNNTQGTSNLFLGTNAGYTNTLGNENLFMGSEAGRLNLSGASNAFLGANAGNNNSTGSRNLFIGTNAGNTTISGSDNTFIGYNSSAAGANAGTLTNATAVGSNALVTTNNTVVLGNAATTITGVGLANSSGLRFPNLKSDATTTSVPGGKVLSVDINGNVVLVQLSTTTLGQTQSLNPNSPVAEKTWKDQDGYLYNNSTNGVVINGSGLEGNSLIVKGGILSKEVNVKVEGSESWPDYVFKPSYKRMTLDEVEKFININGHLPNVASATEMAATGNNLNKTDIKLLEKVEELTLYLLEMKKANEVQNAEIQNLKKQVKSLRKK